MCLDRWFNNNKEFKNKIIAELAKLKNKLTKNMLINTFFINIPILYIFQQFKRYVVNITIIYFVFVRFT